MEVRAGRNRVRLRFLCIVIEPPILSSEQERVTGR